MKTIANLELEANNNMVVIYANDYFEKTLINNSKEDIDKYIENNYNEYVYIEKILSIQIAIFIFRRLSITSGKYDSLNSIEQHLIQEYETKFSKPFIDLNENIDW